MYSKEKLESLKQSYSKSKEKKVWKDLSNTQQFNVDELIEKIIFLCLNEPDETIKKAREKSLFLYYHQGQKIDQVQKIITSLLDLKCDLKLSTESISYLEAKKDFKLLANSYLKFENEIASIYSNLSRESFYFKENGQILTSSVTYDLITILNLWFSTLQIPNKNYLHSNEIGKDSIEYQLYKSKNIFQPFSVYESFTYFDIHDIISGISFLVNKYPVVAENPNLVWMPNKKSIKKNSKRYLKLIELSCKLTTLIEWEASIDFLGYSLQNNNNNQFTISDEQGKEMSIRAGYSKFDQQRAIFQDKFMSTLTDDDISIDKVVNKLNVQEIVSFEGKGRRERIVFKFIDKMLELFGDAKFVDQNKELSYLAKEWSLTDDELLKREVIEGITFIDISNFNIAVQLLSALLTKFITENPKLSAFDLLGAGCFWLSNVQILDLFGKFVEKSKVEKIIDLLSVDIKSPHIDLLYTPILRNEQKYGIFIPLLAATNMLRNSIKNSTKKKYKSITNNDGYDGLAKIVANSFDQNGSFKILENLQYRDNNKNPEIDVIAIGKNNTYFIECKNSLYPTDVFEMRNTLDYLEKAKNQLSIHEENFKEGSLKQRIITELGIDNVPDKVISFIVLGNRLFSGCRDFGYPIRTPFELDNILNNGHIYPHFTENLDEIRLWENETFIENDLVKFLSENDSYISFQNQSLIKIQLTRKLTDFKLNHDSFIMDNSKFYALLKNEYSR